MDLERWRRVKEIFTDVLELPPGERAARLAALPDEPALIAEAESLLAAHERAADFYEKGVLAALPDLREELETAVEGMRIGPYRVLRELGRGGMGAVYLAVRDEPGFTQKVAVKLIKRGMDTDEIVRRFVAERQILASLVHPNIARLLDVGSTPDGRPYLVMEHVEGRPITHHAGERQLGVEARLRLFLRVSAAVQHAHQSLVVHRDLKPANVLVDAAGEPKLLDFGIAKLLDPAAPGATSASSGRAPGPLTPDYASPEQRAGAPVTTATDVYGLGLLLYELLAGESARSLAGKLGDGWRGRPPSQAVRALAAPGDTDKRRLARRLRGDLDTIVGKALAPEPERRYGTALALAEDVERHLTSRPVAARRPTPAYRLGRALVRHKAAATAVLAVCLFAATATYQAVALRQERDRVEFQRQRAEASIGFLLGLIRKANPEESRGETLTVRQVLDAGAEDLLGRDPRYQPATWAAILETTGKIYGDLGLYAPARANLERALRLRLRQPSPDREAVLGIAGNWTALGNIALDQEDYDAGRNAYGRALAIKQRLLPPAAPSPVEDWNGLGLIALAEGDPADAIRSLERALAISRRAATDGQPELAQSLNNLGMVAASQGRFTRARMLFAAALRYFRWTIGDGHPDSILAESNLAYVSFHLADYAAAQELYQGIADRRRRLLGPEHPASARALLQVAIVKYRRKRLAEARSDLDELVELRRHRPSPPDQDEAETWNLLGAIHLEQEELAAAEEAFKKSARLYQSLPGEHRGDLANVVRGQALIRRRRGDLAGALVFARRGLELVRATAGADNPALADPFQLLAELLHRAGQWSRAETAYRQALALRSAPEWADHPARALTLVTLGGLLLDTGRAAEARPFLKEGLRIRRRVLPVGDPAIGLAEAELRRLAATGG